MSIATLEHSSERIKRPTDASITELASTKLRLSLADDDRLTRRLAGTPVSSFAAANLVGTAIRLLVVALIICMTLNFMAGLATSGRPTGGDKQNYSQLGLASP